MFFITLFKTVPYTLRGDLGDSPFTNFKIIQSRLPENQYHRHHSFQFMKVKSCQHNYYQKIKPEVKKSKYGNY